MAVGVTLSGVVLGAVLFGVGLAVKAGFLVFLGILVLALAFLYAVAVPGEYPEQHTERAIAHPGEAESAH